MMINIIIIIIIPPCLPSSPNDNNDNDNRNNINIDNPNPAMPPIVTFWLKGETCGRGWIARQVELPQT